MNQDVSAAKTGSVNEVVAQGEVLRQILIGTVGGQDAQVMFVLGGKSKSEKVAVTFSVPFAYKHTCIFAHKQRPLFFQREQFHNRTRKQICRILTECKRRAVSWMARMCVISKRSS